ncbi:hypothetical protein HMPREF0591_4826 [Mycobacterium parascrofulaceum ATCC BAA-614]|uniref:Uncharacterized protein n=1 Tax=Mycobacterium parascrofulaceum ATCC BAA-614 TaxID=525368 RepID=D5PF82_9MYCO|nr:hypothetical protein [Mycobacterium parascrofulaceum]EFG75263.1 hypothetical protein HMPREF0591_4826 [Mycobacterium parascrofulaceum ATCC BAA-614]
MTSVELRVVNDRDVECDWGIVEYPNPQPHLDRVGHLMLTAADYVTQLLTAGPATRLDEDGRIDSATTTDGRRFVHTEYKGHRWTWELFDAHWWDGITNGHDWLIGRWPD